MAVIVAAPVFDYFWRSFHTLPVYRAAYWRRTVAVLNWISKEIEWRRPSSILNGHWWSIMVRSRSFDSSSQCFRNLGRDLGVASPQTPLNMISLPLGDSTDAQMPIPDPSRPTMQWKGGFATVAQSNRLYGRLLNFTHFQRNCWLVRKQRDTQPETAAFSLKMLILEAFCRFAHSRWLVTRLSSFRFILFLL